MDDNLMPNEGAYYQIREPEDQVLERKHEKAKTLESKKELEKVIKHLDERIAATDSIKQAEGLAKAKEISIQLALHVLSLVNNQLQTERQFLTDLLEVHSKR